MVARITPLVLALLPAIEFEQTPTGAQRKIHGRPANDSEAAFAEAWKNDNTDLILASFSAKAQNLSDSEDTRALKAEFSAIGTEMSRIENAVGEVTIPRSLVALRERRKEISKVLNEQGVEKFEAAVWTFLRKAFFALGMREPMKSLPYTTILRHAWQAKDSLDPDTRAALAAYRDSKKAQDIPAENPVEVA